jgi:DNA-binding transcriptional MerR regulator
VLTISQAAARLALTPRALRYREALGLLPLRHASGRHRRFSEDDLDTLREVLRIEQQYHVGPGEVAFALRALSDGVLAARLRGLSGTAGGRALAFEQAKAERLLHLQDRQRRDQRSGRA